MGKVTYADLGMKVYPNDTSATAVVLNEIGNAYISEEVNEGLIFQRYLKIKILKRQGFDQANFEILLHKQENSKEDFRSVVASTFNLTGNKISESKMDLKGVFTENVSQYTNAVKFTLPDIREGSVIEVAYSLNSPFIFNFRPWEFQSDIPKVRSEYSTLIPANYTYNITLKGFYKLGQSESSLVKDCFRIGGGVADCSLTKYAMVDIPAFVDEDYMTARRNFVSAIQFELSEIKYFDGRVDKKTKEWKDVDLELRQDDDFGDQVRKAKNLLEDKVQTITGRQTDTLKNAKAIYNFIKSWYSWNENYGKYAELGVKKAFESRKGNAADINLSLAGAFQSAGINAYPALLSTRENGLPNPLHPVISDFNYVIVVANIGGRQYQLDATNPLRPFGLLPVRCLNGKGRLMAKESTWVNLTPREKQKKIQIVELAKDEEGWHGTIDNSYYGYEALGKRTDFASAGDKEAYARRLQKEWDGIEVLDYQIRNLDSLETPLQETARIKIAASEPGAGIIYFNPFVIDRWESNPFKSNERLYPVDFGAPIDQIFILKLTYPATYEIDDLPRSVALTLPQEGGRFLFNVSNVGNVLTITTNLTINKSVYNSAEYHYLKEFFARIVSIQQSQIVFKKK